MTIPQPPAGQGPVDPRGAFSPPPPPPGGAGANAPMPPSPTGMPPPLMYPPMMYPPPPPPAQPKTSFVRAVFMTLATSIFGLSIAANIYLLIFTGFLTGGDGTQQTTLVSGDAKQKVIVVPLTGLIDSQAVRRFDKLLKRAENDPNTKAIVIELDTPGGTVTGADEVYHRILRLKQTRKLPVVVSMGSLGTSGGYYVSCAADWIVAQRTTITGNIGVMLPRYNVSKLADRWGVEDTSLHSTGATYKTAGSPLKPETAEERAYWLGLIDDAFATFRDVVETGRGGRLKAPMEVIANGKAYAASEALDMGLIDQSGYPGDAYDKAASLAGLTNKHVVRYEPTPSLMQLLGAESKLAAAAHPGLTINGINVNLDSSMLYELTTPRLMYLWRGD